MGAGSIPEAIAAYRDSIESDPQHLASYNNLAIAFRQLGQLSEAIDTYRQALKINPGIAELHYNLGFVFLDSGQREEAADCFRQALELSPNNAEAAFHLHAALFDDQDFEPAIECLKQTLIADPTHELAHLTLGAIQDFAGNVEEAKGHFDSLFYENEGDHPAIESWNHIKAKRDANTRWFAPAADTLRYCLAEAAVTGSVLEFGVRNGASLRLIAAAADQLVHSFDNNQNLPDLPETVTRHSGPFEESVPAYMEKFDEPVRFLHVDCDLFISTVAILENLAPRIVAGSVIVFNEYLMQPGSGEGAFKEFQEAAAEHGWEYEYIAFSLFAKQVGIRILNV